MIALKSQLLAQYARLQVKKKIQRKISKMRKKKRKEAKKMRKEAKKKRKEAKEKLKARKYPERQIDMS